MAGFSAAARLLDEQAAAHLGDPAIYRAQGAGGGVSIAAMLTRPSNAVTMQNASFVTEQPFIETLVAAAPGLAQGDTLTIDGRLWRVEGAPERPDDGAWWKAYVVDIGAAP